jgi:hypothetical protein
MILALSRVERPITTATPTVPTITATEITRHTTTPVLDPLPTLPRMVTSTRSEFMGAGRIQWIGWQMTHCGGFIRPTRLG